MTSTWRDASLSYSGRDSSLLSMDTDSIFRGNRRVAFWTIQHHAVGSGFIAALNAPWCRTIRAPSRAELVRRVREIVG